MITKEEVTKNKEAIQMLHDMSVRFVPTDQYGDYDDPEPYEQAIDTAIEVLEKELNRFEMIMSASERYLGIVRCKDCRWYEDPDRRIFENCVRNNRIIPMDPTDFCSYGEREEE